jgi:hypothetical protein
MTKGCTTAFVLASSASILNAVVMGIEGDMNIEEDMT